MKAELAPSYVSDVIPFPYVTCESLQEIKTPTEPTQCIIGKISEDGRWSYMANGQCLEIISTSTGERISTWRAASKIGQKNGPVSISCVRELKSTNRFNSKLVIGLDCGVFGGLVCLFDIKSSKILKCIEIPHKVTAIEVISSFGGANLSNQFLCLEFRCMFGVIAVGTSEGHVYLVDLCLDEEDMSDESNPSRLFFISANMQDVPQRREEAFGRQQHLCVALDETAVNQHYFNLKSANGKIELSVTKETVSVTAIKYLPHLNSLAVGYSFGAFQLWNLEHLIIELSNHDGAVDYEQSSAIVQFAYQEPENDPRPYSYLWVARGVLSLDTRHDTVASLNLYSLMYSQKNWVQSLGNCYTNLQSCSLRFEYYLTHDSTGPLEVEMCGSRILSLSAIENNSNGNPFTFEEGVENSELNLMVVAWEAWCLDAMPSTKGFIAIFDLNQWYQSQMPSSVRVSGVGSSELCSFFGIFSLQEVMEKASPDFILDVQVDANSISAFHKTMPNELFFYPSALSFKICCLIELGFLNASYLGFQRQVLFDLRRAGPAVLMEPRDAYNMCVNCGLLVKPIDSHLSQTVLRETLLTMALDNNLVDFIGACVSQWGNREYSNSGCSLRFIMEWAWRQAGQIKNNMDKLCLPLFNYSGVQLDPLQAKQLQYYTKELHHLIIIFKLLATHSTPITDQGLRELDAKRNVVTLLHDHYKIISWCRNIGLLPEQEEGETYGGEEFAFPAALLIDTYNNRRRELQKINSLIRGTDLLLIDGLVAHAGDAINNLWEKDGGSGLFPPPSLYSLLNIYLLDGISLTTKHQIVLYFFLDLAACLSEEKHGHILTKLMNFAPAFSIAPNLSKVTHAFWLLDHKDFEGAIHLLCHPNVTVCDFEPWQNTVIVKSLLYQGEESKALKYCTIQRPTLNTPEDMKLYLTLLLANGLIVQAFEFQRECRDQTIAEDLLQHFFLGCQQTKRMNTVFQLPLSGMESEVLVQFLHSSNKPQTKEMLVMYFLQKNNFLQALTLNDRLKTELNVIDQERAVTRNLIVDGYAKVLPNVQQTLTANADLYRLGAAVESGCRVVPKPQPLSTVIKPCNMKVVSQATLIRAVLDKVAEIDSKPPEEEPLTPMMSRRRRSSTFACGDKIPFVRTPLTPKETVCQTDVAEIVYPVIMTRDKETLESYADYLVSPSKRSRFMDITPSKRRISKHLSAELMSMLQTPPLRRKKPIRAQSVVSTTPQVQTCLTPQSILKVRQLVQRTTSPPQPMDTSFLLSNRQPTSDIEESNVINESLIKQLRFALPREKKEETSPKWLDGTLGVNQASSDSPPPLELRPRRPIRSPESTSSPSFISSEHSTPIREESNEEFFEFSPPLMSLGLRENRTRTTSQTYSERSPRVLESEDDEVELDPSVDKAVESNHDSSNSLSVDITFATTEENEERTERELTPIHDELKQSPASNSSIISWHSASSPSFREQRTPQESPPWTPIASSPKATQSLILETDSLPSSPSQVESVTSKSREMKMDSSCEEVTELPDTADVEDTMKVELAEVEETGKIELAKVEETGKIASAEVILESGKTVRSVSVDVVQAMSYEVENVKKMEIDELAARVSEAVKKQLEKVKTVLSESFEMKDERLNKGVPDERSRDEELKIEELDEKFETTETEEPECELELILTTDDETRLEFPIKKEEVVRSVEPMEVKTTVLEPEEDEEIEKKEVPAIARQRQQKEPQTPKQKDGKKGVVKPKTPSPVRTRTSSTIDSESESPFTLHTISPSRMELRQSSRKNSPLESKTTLVRTTKPLSKSKWTIHNKQNVEEAETQATTIEEPPASTGRLKGNKAVASASFVSGRKRLRPRTSLIAVTQSKTAQSASSEKASVKKETSVTKKGVKAQSTVSVNVSPHSYNTRLRSKSPDSKNSSPATASPDSEGKKSIGSQRRVGNPSVRKNLMESMPPLPPRIPEPAFLFSPPATLSQTLTVGESGDIGQDVKPFIFSPPLTRSRTRKGKRPSDAEETRERERSEMQKIEERKKVTKKKVTTKKSVRERKIPSPEVQMSNSPINFLTPVVKSEKKVNARVRRSSRFLGTKKGNDDFN